MVTLAIVTIPRNWASWNAPCSPSFGGSATPLLKAVREELGRPLKDSTIRTVLRRLEEKGYLTHAVEARTFVYRSSESPERVAGRAVQRIVDWFCGGSVETLLVGMVDSKVLDQVELKGLTERIAAARKQAGQKASVIAKKEEKL